MFLLVLLLTYDVSSSFARDIFGRIMFHLGIKDDERSKVVVKNTRINPTAAIQFECQQYEPQGLKAFIKMVCSLSTNNTLMGTYIFYVHM